MPSLDRDRDVFVIDLGPDQNRWDPPWMDELGLLLERAVCAPQPRALVTKASGRYWSTGLDLNWLETHPGQEATLGTKFLQILAQVLTLPVPCVAAIEGHAVGAGAMLALAHDLRVMADGSARVWMPEVDIGMAFTDGVAALIQAKLAPFAAHRSMVIGYRWSAAEAGAAGMVDEVTPSGSAVERARALARELASKRGDTVGAIKHRMYGAVRAQLLHDAEELTRS